MACDAHVHPYYLHKEDFTAEEERIKLNIRCAASSFNRDEFIYNEALSKRKNSPCMALCFAVHPQLSAHNNNSAISITGGNYNIDELLLLLETLSRDKRIHAIGEAGFDLFNNEFKVTEKNQEAIFARHVAIAEQCHLPLVLHVRRAMHKIFEHTKTLKRLPAVVFHSYSGSLEEAESLLKRGINAYFSFGTAILMNHKNAARCVALLPSDRLLFETDAPYQPLYPQKHSRYADIFSVIWGAAELRKESGTGECTAGELEKITDTTFTIVFGGMNE
jgi:TatD DNase family protein